MTTIYDFLYPLMNDETIQSCVMKDLENQVCGQNIALCYNKFTRL